MQANAAWKSKVVACRLQTGYSTCRSSPRVATDMRLSRRTTKFGGMWAIRLDPHPNGLAMKEDFVETQHEDSRLTGPVEDLQDTARLYRGLLHPAPHRGSTGHDSPGQHDG